jgi:hypothetical protein
MGYPHAAQLGQAHGTVLADRPQLNFRLSRHAMTSSSLRTASSIGMTGRASKTKAGSMEQNLCTVTGSSQSAII